MVSEESVYTILDKLGIVVESESGNELTCMCPLHDNFNSPAFSINVNTGAWICFSGRCNKSGGLKQLWDQLKPDEPYPFTDRRLKEFKAEKEKNEFFEELESIYNPEVRVPLVDWTETLDKLDKDADELQYLTDRGFTKGTLNQFEVCWSSKKKRIVIPVRDENYRVAGLIGRAPDDLTTPKYLYSKDFPKKGVLFNLHHAKAHKSVILVEGSLDCARVVQAGYPNTCAVLGSSLSDEQARLIERYFLSVIIFSDRDAAGLGLANTIANKCSTRDVWYANWDLIEDEGLDDPGKLSDDQIRVAIDNKISDIELRLSDL